MSQAKEINHELNIISRYMGLIISKYLIFALLIITLYPMNIIPGYILLAGIIFPAALRFAVNLETSPDKNTASPKKADVSDRECSFTLSHTAKKYNFSTERRVYPMAIQIFGKSKCFDTKKCIFLPGKYYSQFYAYNIHNITLFSQDNISF